MSKTNETENGSRYFALQRKLAHDRKLLIQALGVNCTNCVVCPLRDCFTICPHPRVGLIGSANPNCIAQKGTLPDILKERVAEELNEIMKDAECKYNINISFEKQLVIILEDMLGLIEDVYNQEEMYWKDENEGFNKKFNKLMELANKQTGGSNNE